MKISAPTMADLIHAVYKREGWQYQIGESRTARVKTAYNLSLDYKSNKFVATKKT